MFCPRCEVAVLDEQDRQGIVIDICPSCRGVWLDRGELERLLTREADAIARIEGGASGVAAPEPTLDEPRKKKKKRGRDDDRRGRRDDDDFDLDDAGGGFLGMLRNIFD